MNNLYSICSRLKTASLKLVLLLEVSWFIYYSSFPDFLYADMYYESLRSKVGVIQTYANKEFSFLF